MAPTAHMSAGKLPPQPTSQASGGHLGGEAEVDELELAWLGLGLGLGFRGSLVDELELALSSEQDVLRLDVRVAQALRVHQRHRAAQLLQQRRRLLLRVRADLGEVVEELSARHELTHDVVMRLTLVVRLKLGDARVHAHALEHLHLTPHLVVSLHALVVGSVIVQGLWNHLDGHSLAGLPAFAPVDDAVGAVTQLLPRQLVVSHELREAALVLRPALSPSSSLEGEDSLSFHAAIGAITAVDAAAAAMRERRP
eukprot:scaffold1396_cov73-Phaeocystis_antarctica.AAC.1